MMRPLNQFFFYLLILILTARESFATYTCASLFTDTIQQPTLQYIQDLYQKTDTETVDRGATFKESLTTFEIMYLGKSDPDTMILHFHQPLFSKQINKRLNLLFARPLDLSKNHQLKIKLKKAQDFKFEVGHWMKAFEAARSDRTEPFTLDQFRHFERTRAPRIDQTNISTYTEISNWQNAVQYIYQIAKYKAPLNKDHLLQIIAHLENKKTVTPWPGESIIDQFSLNLMKQTDREGHDMTDPKNVFPAGTSKKALLEEFLSWLEQNEGVLHPIVLSAQARQRIVSIHPLPDGNGRLARIIGDYVLMKNGYPPATIAASRVGRNTSVALFPLKNWKHQISPEETVQITLDGVLESYRRILERKD